MSCSPFVGRKILSLFTVATLALITAGVVRGGDAFSLTFDRNESCADAGVSSLVFQGVDAVPAGIDYCQAPVEDLPPMVRHTLGTVSRIHHGLAKVMNSTIEKTFGLDFTIAVLGNSEGPLSSYASGNGMVVGAFPDWKETEFPAKVYAHELVHVLTLNGGSFSTPMAGLRHHPFLSEALPDLLAAEVNDSPVLDLGDESLPACLNRLRDETPLKGMDLPLRHFSSSGSTEQMQTCCASLSPTERTGRTQAICANYTGRIYSHFNRTELEAPFNPKSCFVTTKGFTLFAKCDDHQFGYPLTSFFFSLRDKIGRSVVQDFTRLMLRQSTSASSYRCSYTRAGAGGLKPVVLKVRSVSPLFAALRNELAPAERVAFDATWKEHAMEKMVELDQLYAPVAPKAEAVRELAEKNPGHAIVHSCLNPGQMNGLFCDVECRSL